jgi:ribosome-binding factor A
MEKETTRQLKVARQIQKDLSEILTQQAAGIIAGVMASVTAVRVSPDLSFARVYLSIFPFERAEEAMAAIERNNWLIRKTLGGRVRNQLRIVPELAFMLDDSLEYIENLDKLLK